MYSIAIDGPSASGKSSVCKELAKRLKINHLSSGLIYRAIALYLLENNLNYKFVATYLNDINIDVKFQNYSQIIYLNSKDVTGFLHTEEISTLSSIVSQVKEVREFVKKVQNKVANSESIIIDGRDITTEILPNAKYKFFLTASVKSRAERRYLQYNKTIPLKEIEKDIEERDYKDSNRKLSPLKQAKDAILIDSSNLNLEETVNEFLKYIKE